MHLHGSEFGAIFHVLSMYFRITFLDLLYKQTDILLLFFFSFFFFFSFSIFMFIYLFVFFMFMFKYIMIIGLIYFFRLLAVCV